jgi:homogentisate phytyltransferase / homogentisate geranylgeranyltransferase
LGAALIAQIQAPFLIVTQVAALIALWVLSRRVDLQDKASIAQFYQFIWKLFFLEYLLFPIACLLGQR